MSSLKAGRTARVAKRVRAPATPVPPGTQRASAPPRRPVDFTTCVGRLGDLLRIIDEWDSIRAGFAFSISAPLVVPVKEDAPGEPSGDLADLRVAVIRHPPTATDIVGRQIAAYVEANIQGVVRVDPGYWLAPASVAARVPGQTSWNVTWNPRRMAALQSFPRQDLGPAAVGSGAGAEPPRPLRVLLLDTGDERACKQEAFVMSEPMGTAESPRDWHGHGTSLGDVVRLRAPEAEVSSVRIFERTDRYSASTVLLCALIAATSPVADADIVGVAQRALVTGDTTKYAETINYIFERAVERKGPLPIVVCAAGNTRNRERMGLPAIVPGVLVARAVDWKGEPTAYNCEPPADCQVAVIDAFGGLDTDPLGETVAADGRRISMVGTSYAAALAIGALSA